MPHWSPDGAWIYFGPGYTDRDTEAEVHRVPSFGGPSVRVTQGWEGIPSHDGRSIFVTRRVEIKAWRCGRPAGRGPSRRLAERVVPMTIAVGRRAVYFASLSGGPLRELSIGEVEIASELERRLGTLGKMSMWLGLSVSPDERTLIVSAVNAVGANLMVLEPAR